MGDADAPVETSLMVAEIHDFAPIGLVMLRSLTSIGHGLTTVTPKAVMFALLAAALASLALMRRRRLGRYRKLLRRIRAALTA